MEESNIFVKLYGFIIPHSTTLHRRLAGIEYRAEKRANSHKMTQYEEQSLRKWIIDLEKRGLPPRPSLIQDMANLLLS